MTKQLMIAAILLSFLACQRSYTLEETSTTRILRTLSSDDMRGRAALTKDITKAEEFIADEFEKAGLGYFGDLNSYKQTFNLKEVTISKAAVQFNGETVAPSRFFGFIYDSNVQWSPESVSVETISTGDNFRNKFNEFRSSESDLLVFVDYDFEEIFSRYHSFFSRANRAIEGTEHANVVFALASQVPNSFEVSFEIEKELKKLSNVVGVLEGKRSDEFLLFSAHHDHIGIRAVANGDSIGNGANDNASGVTAVIELAHYFSAHPKPERTLIFTTFTAEEMGGYGSQFFSQQVEPEKIVAMFNIEMIGKPAVSGPNTAWITGYERSTFGELLSKSTEGTVYEFYADPYPDQNLFYRSDNATLARLGVPAHTISTTPIDVDPDYHEVSDEFETIDIAHLTNTIKAIAKAAEGMVSGKDTPTRVDASNID